MLEKSGRDLWNLCIRLKRDVGRDSKLDCRVRLLAFHLLELARPAEGRTTTDEETDIIYFLGLSMTVGRVCLQDEDLESGRAALQKAAEFVERLKAANHRAGIEGLPPQAVALETDYLTMRMALVSSESISLSNPY